MTASADLPSVTNVQSLERGLAVIRAFDADHARLTLSDVARRTDLSRATARRFLHTLVALGYMHTDGRYFWLRPRILELGFAYLSSVSLPELAAPHLRRLSDEIDESSSVSVLDGAEVVYVSRVAVRRIMTAHIAVGTRFPAWVTSMGRVLLAGLPAEELAAVLDRSAIHAVTPYTLHTRLSVEEKIAEVRADGYALNDQELEVGLRSIAVGIRDARHRVIAAINASVPSMRFSADHIKDRVLPALLVTRDAIERDVAARFPDPDEPVAW